MKKWNAGFVALLIMFLISRASVTAQGSQSNEDGRSYVVVVLGISLDNLDAETESLVVWQSPDVGSDLILVNGRWASPLTVSRALEEWSIVRRFAGDDIQPGHMTRVVRSPRDEGRDSSRVRPWVAKVFVELMNENVTSLAAFGETKLIRAMVRVN